MCWFPPGCVRVVVDLFNTVHHLLVLLLLYSTYSNVFVSHPDVSAWWWTYLTRCMGSVLNLVDVGAKTYLEVGECASFSRRATFSLRATPKPIWKLVSVLYFH